MVCVVCVHVFECCVCVCVCLCVFVCVCVCVCHITCLLVNDDKIPPDCVR